MRKPLVVVLIVVGLRRLGGLALWKHGPKRSAKATAAPAFTRRPIACRVRPRTFAASSGAMSSSTAFIARCRRIAWELGTRDRTSLDMNALAPILWTD